MKKVSLKFSTYKLHLQFKRAHEFSYFQLRQLITDGRQTVTPSYCPILKTARTKLLFGTSPMSISCLSRILEPFEKEILQSNFGENIHCMALMSHVCSPFLNERKYGPELYSK